MSDLAVTLRLRADNQGLVSVVDASGKKIKTFGRDVDQSSRQAESGMRRVRTESDSVSDGLRRLQRIGAAGLGIAGISAVISRVRRLAVDAVQLSVAAEETANKFNVVMGPATEAVRADLARLTDIVPLTIAQLEAMTAGIQDMLVPMGLARERAAGLSTQAVSLAADLASFNNVGTDQVLTAIQSGLAGMSQPLRQFGIDISQSRLEALALEEGLIRKGEALDNTSRALAVFAAIQRDSSDAIGDAARTVDSAANQIRFLQRDSGQLAEDLGEKLQPAAVSLVGGLRDLVSIGDELVQNWEAVSKVGQALSVIITARLVVALAAATKAKAVNLILSRQLAVGWTAGAGAATAKALAVGTLNRALALVGGPAGLAAAGLVLVGKGLFDARREALALRQPSQEAATALEQLRRIASEGWQPEQINAVNEQLGVLQSQLQAVSRERARVQGIMDRSGGGLLGQWLRSMREEGLEELKLTEELLAEQIRMAEHLSGQQQHEDLANGLGLITRAGAAAVDVMERLGFVSRNAAGGWGEMAAASQEIVGPLDSQVEQLRQQVFLLTHGEAAMVDYMKAQALARAALQDVTDGTKANVEATHRYFQAIRTLTEEERRLRQEQENRTKAAQQATAAQAAMQVRANGVASAYQQLLAQLQPVRAEQERLTALLAEATHGGEEWQRMLEAAGLTAAQAAELVDLIGQALDDLDIDGTKALEESLEGLRRAADPAYEAAALLAEELDELQKLADAGLIDETEFERLSAWLKAAYDDAMSLAEAFDIMAGAAGATLRAVQQFAGQGSKEFQALEIAINALALVQGISAILNQGQGEPYSAPVRMALMAAAIAPLIANLAGSIGNFGGSGGGFSDTAGQRQASQGTGSVLGDAEAKSESILRATEITADATRELVGINRGMLRALINLNNALAGAGRLLARGAGQAEIDSSALSAAGSFNDLLDPLGLTGSLGNFFSDPLGILGGSSKITDEGILIISGTIGQMIEEVMFGAYQEVQSRSWRFGRRRTRTGVGDLDDQVVSQFQLVFEALADTVFEGAVALGLSADAVEEAIRSFVVPETFISLMDLSGEEQQRELEAVFGQIFDNLAGSVVPWIAQFQQVGEGLGETLVRVATGVQVMHEAISRLGFSLDEADPEKFAQASEGLIGLMGGLDEFINGLVNFFDKFADEATRFATAQGDLERAFDQVGLALPATRDAMWELMQSLDATTESGREQIAMLLELTDVADAYYSYLEAVESERLGLERQILQLQGDTVALRQLELEKLDESNRELQMRIWALEDEIELAGILANAGDEIARLSMSPLRFEFRQLSQTQRELTARVRELTDSEEHLAQIRQMHDLQNMALAERAMTRLRAIQEQLWGANDSSSNAGPDFTPIDQAALRVRDSLIRALESVAEWVRRSSFMDPSLRPVDQMAAMQAEFDRLMNIALTGSGQEQADAIAALPQLASQMETLGAQLWGTATAEFQDFRTGLVDAMEGLLDSVVPPPEPDPVTGAQVGGIAGAIDQVVLSLGEQKMLAAEALEVLGVIRALTGESPLEIAREFGVPLRDAIELLIGELGEGTAETIEQLAHIANTLGVNLTELSEELGLNIGELIDHESLLSQALRDVIDGLPAGIQDQLLDPLNRIWTATDEADANAALAELNELTGGLPAGIRNLLQPYLEDIDPVDYLSEQVGLMEVMAEYDRRQADAADMANNLLFDLLDAVRAANSFNDVPGYATGGWVNQNQIIRAGEAGRELILPNPVSEFFAREGIPVRVGGGSGSSADSVAELRRIAQLIEDGNRDRRDVANEQIVVVTDLKAEMAGINQSISREGVTAWPQRR